MSIPAGTWCLACTERGHKCQAQFYVLGEPYCRDCEAGKPCSFDRVRAAEPAPAAPEGEEFWSTLEARIRRSKAAMEIEEKKPKMTRREAAAASVKRFRPVQLPKAKARIVKTENESNKVPAPAKRNFFPAAKVACKPKPKKSPPKEPLPEILAPPPIQESCAPKEPTIVINEPQCAVAKEKTISLTLELTDSEAMGIFAKLSPLQKKNALRAAFEVSISQ